MRLAGVMTDGGSCSPHMYVAWVLTDILTANEVSEVGEITMGVATHHICGTGAVLVYAAMLPGCKGG